MAVALTTLPKETVPQVSEQLWEDAGHLPCVLSVDLRVKRFTVRDLLQLESGVILESKNAEGADIPVLVNERLVGWAEFEVVAKRIAVRITELA